MVSLYKDPNGDRIFDNNANGRGGMTTQLSLEGGQTDSQLQQRVKELERLLRELQVLSVYTT